MLTKHLNLRNTDYVFNGQWRVAVADGSLPIVQLALWGSQAFYISSNQICLNHKLIVADFIPHSFYHTATFKLSIENPGEGQRYFGGCYIEGKGNSTTNNYISDLINIGYKTTEPYVPAAIDDLTYKTYNNLFKTSVNISKFGSGSTKAYLSETMSLSNPYKNVYCCSVELKSPYNLNKAGHSFQIYFGLMGTDSDSLKYHVMYYQDPWEYPYD